MIGRFKRTIFKRNDALKSGQSAALRPAATKGRTRAGADVSSAGIPAGAEPRSAATQVPTRRRARLRKRARYLEQLHQLLLRDLGGYAFEVHRYGGGFRNLPTYSRVTDAKLARINAVIAELHAINSVLKQSNAEVVVRQPGIGGLCPSCHEPFASQAKFCSYCGLPLHGALARDISPVQARVDTATSGSKMLNQATQGLEPLESPLRPTTGEPAYAAHESESITRKMSQPPPRAHQ